MGTPPPAATEPGHHHHAARLCLLLVGLAQASPLLPSLPAGCGDFTVGECSPEQDELIDTYADIPDSALCQTLCGIQEGCNYFRHSKSSLDCTLYHYRFLTSCNLIAGPEKPGIDECSHEEEPSCDSFVRENCVYNGENVLEKESITDSHDCTLYTTKEADCDAISGPSTPSMDSCNNPTSPNPTTAPTTVPTTKPTAAHY